MFSGLIGWDGWCVGATTGIGAVVNGIPVTSGFTLGVVWSTLVSKDDTMFSLLFAGTATRSVVSGGRIDRARITKGLLLGHQVGVGRYASYLDMHGVLLDRRFNVLPRYKLSSTGMGDNKHV
jgi:hypothetical protein